MCTELQLNRMQVDGAFLYNILTYDKLGFIILSRNLETKARSGSIQVHLSRTNSELTHLRNIIFTVFWDTRGLDFVILFRLVDNKHYIIINNVKPAVKSSWIYTASCQDNAHPHMKPSINWLGRHSPQ